MPPTLTTPRILLRPFSMDDVDEAYEVLEGHPDVWGIDPGYQRTREQRARRIQLYTLTNDEGGLGNLACIHRESGKLMGYAGLQYYLLPGHPYNTPEVDLFYKLGRDWWGQGYATEACTVMIDFAFNTLHLGRITNTVMAENSQSISLMQRLGFDIQPAPPTWEGWLLGVLDNPGQASKG